MAEDSNIHDSLKGPSQAIQERASGQQSNTKSVPFGSSSGKTKVQSRHANDNKVGVTVTDAATFCQIKFEITDLAMGGDPVYSVNHDLLNRDDCFYIMNHILTGKHVPRGWKKTFPGKQMSEIEKFRAAFINKLPHLWLTVLRKRFDITPETIHAPKSPIESHCCRQPTWQNVLFCLSQDSSLTESNRDRLLCFASSQRFPGKKLCNDFPTEVSQVLLSLSLHQVEQHWFQRLSSDMKVASQGGESASKQTFEIKATRPQGTAFASDVKPPKKLRSRRSRAKICTTSSEQIKFGFSVQNFILKSAQQILETAGFDALSKTDPGIILRHGWTTPDQLELNRCVHYFREAKNAASHGIPDGSIWQQIIQKVVEIRNRAVHRANTENALLIDLIGAAVRLAEVGFEDKSAVRLLNKMHLMLISKDEELAEGVEVLKRQAAADKAAAAAAATTAQGPLPRAEGEISVSALTSDLYKTKDEIPEECRELCDDLEMVISHELLTAVKDLLKNPEMMGSPF